MELIDFVILAGAAFLTSIISAIVGTGGGFLMLVTFSLFFDIKTAIALSGLYFMINNLNKVGFYFRTVDWKFCLYLLLGGIPACVFGLYILHLSEPRFLNYFLAFMGFYLLFDHFYDLPKLKNFTPRKILVSGGIWGFFSGLANAAPIKVMLLKWKGFSKHIFVGTGAIISLSLDVIKIVGYSSMNLLQWKYVVWVAPLFFVSFSGNWIGKKILNKVSHELFEKLLLLVVFLSSLKFLFWH